MIGSAPLVHPLLVHSDDVIQGCCPRGFIPLKQPAHVFDNFVTELHTHALFRDRKEEGFKRPFGLIASVIIHEV
jgi:hypothetical protein